MDPLGEDGKKPEKTTDIGKDSRLKKKKALMDNEVKKFVTCSRCLCIVRFSNRMPCFFIYVVS